MCEDRVPGGWRPGGPSLFSAVAACRLGTRVHLIGAWAAGAEAFLDGVDAEPGFGHPARYENRYDEAGSRTQLLLHRGSPLYEPTLPSAEDVLIVAPAFHEVRRVPGGRRHAVIGVALQGVLRSIRSGRAVVARADPWRSARPFVVPGGWAFLSEEDTADSADLGRRLARAGMSAFVTRGARGAILYQEGGEKAYSALAAEPVDPTGAGDCFATAFIVRFAETRDVEVATRFALAAGALAVEGHGLAGVPDRAMVEARLERVAA